MTHHHAKHFLNRFWTCTLVMASATVAPAQSPQRADQPPSEAEGKISARVRARAQAGGMMPVFIVMNRQPHAEIIGRVHEVAGARLRSAQSDYFRLTGQQLAPPVQVDLAQAQLNSVIADIRQEAFRQIEADIRPDQDLAESTLRSVGAVDVQRYSILNMLRATVPASALAALDADPTIASIVLIEKMAPHLAESVPFLWTGKINGHIPAGYTGNGQAVAILDTGIRTDHPAFLALRNGPGIPAKAFLSHTEFDGSNPPKRNGCFADNSATTEDLEGHGTHVAGIVASRGGQQLQQADWTGYKGVAPGATLVNLKVAAKQSDKDRCGGKASASDDDVLAAIQWTLTNRPTSHTSIFNASLGHCVTDNNGACLRWDEDDKFSQILDSIADYWGITLVVAAGNDGVKDRHKKPPDCTPQPNSVTSPGIAYNILSVANIVARDRPDEAGPPACAPGPIPTIWPSSSKGTAGTPVPGSAHPIGRRKPDIAAPGTYIYSAAFDWNLPNAQQKSCNNTDLRPTFTARQFVCKTGTSMAAPHVAGAVAVLQNRPEVHPQSPAECAVINQRDTTNALAVKALLLNSANFEAGASGWKPDAGWGWANLSNAIQQLDLGVKQRLPVVMASCVQTPLQNPPVNTPARHYRFFKGPVDAQPAHPFKATLAWNQHVTWGPVDKLPAVTVWSEKGSPNPVVAAEPSHLRLRMYDTATDVRLDKDPAPNTEDTRNNVQQLVHAQNVKEMVVKVYREAGFGPDRQEAFGLAVSQPLTPAVGPKLGLSCAPNIDPVSHAPKVICAITNTGDLPLFNLAVQPVGGAACNGIDPKKPLEANGNASCSIVSGAVGLMTINATAIFAEETFRATATSVPLPPPPTDCHGVTLNPVKATVGPAGGTGSFQVIFPDPTKCSLRDLSVPPTSGWIMPTFGPGSTVTYSVLPLNPPPPKFLPPPPPNPPRSGFIMVGLRDYNLLLFEIDQTAK